MNLVFLLCFLYISSFITAYSNTWIIEQQNFYYQGLKKTCITINDSIPGPFIIAEEGETIEVIIQNILLTQSTSIHWHGMDQRGTNFMDGVPDITECGIKPNSAFTYRFQALPAGTHWYHSHSGAQYMDGSFGAMVIRAKNDPHKDLYDYDLDNHIIIFNDFFTEPGEELIIDLINGGFSGGPVSDIPFEMGVVNGYLGPFTPPDGTPTNWSRKSIVQPFNPNKHAIFTVTKGKKYRFRMIDASSNMGFRFSIDNHTQLVLAISGGNIQPKTVTSFVTMPGERFDFVLDANQEVGNYWMRFENAHGASMRAILRYEGADDEEPNPVNDCPPLSQCTRVKEYLIRAYAHDSEHDFRSDCCNQGLWPDIDPCCQAGMGDFVPTIMDDMHTIEPAPFPATADRAETFRILGIMKPEFVLHFNSIIFAFPSTPLVFSKGRYGLKNTTYKSDLGKSSFLRSDHEELIDRMGQLRVETQLRFLKVGEVIDLIINNNGPMIHPLHLHGHRFWYLGSSKPLTDPILHNQTSLDVYVEYDPAKHASLLNTVDPPYIDTFPVPDHGWAYLRYRADNPGAWIFHCHLDPHLAAGMSLAFIEGSETDNWPIPDDSEFPVCGTNVGISKVTDLEVHGRKIYWSRPDYGDPDSFVVMLKRGKETIHNSGTLPYNSTKYYFPESVTFKNGDKIMVRAKNVFGRKSLAILKFN